MYPSHVQKLIDLFTKFPGIGPRQATRFVFFLLKNGNGLSQELITTLTELNRSIISCPNCFRAMEKKENAALCDTCADTRRTATQIAILEKESDMHNLEKIGDYRGHYHILGGVISPLDSDSPRRLHLRELYMRVESLLKTYKTCEVILATNPTTEGDTTALYIEQILKPLRNHYPQLTLSRLGRGLSLGSELEYTDEITLKNALQNRK